MLRRKLGRGGRFAMASVALTALTLSATGCSSTNGSAPSTPAAASTASPANVQQLTAALLGVGDLPAGYTTAPVSVLDIPASPDPDCSTFTDGYSFVDSAGRFAAGAATQVLGPTDAAGYGWRSVETLLSYAGDGAHTTMEGIRKLVAKCPTGKDLSGDPTRFALAAGAGVGDESLTVTALTTKNQGIRVADTDVTVIRRGNVLIVVQESVSLTGSTDQLISVAKMAHAKVAHSATGG